MPTTQSTHATLSSSARFSISSTTRIVLDDDEVTELSRTTTRTVSVHQQPGANGFTVFVNRDAPGVYSAVAIGVSWNADAKIPAGVTSLNPPAVARASRTDLPGLLRAAVEAATPREQRKPGGEAGFLRSAASIYAQQAIVIGHLESAANGASAVFPNPSAG